VSADLKLLRLTLMRELETINQYQDFAAAAEDPAVRELMEHLMFEEKEHVAELTEMLKRYDADQLKHFHGEHAARFGGSGAGESPAAAPDPEPPAAPGAPEAALSAGVRGAGALTVGSLLGQPQP